MKRILITGICGFVGSHMADYILKQSADVKVFGLKRWRSREDNIKHLLNHPQVEFLEGDLLDTGSLNRVIAVSKPDLIYHFAAQSFPGASFKIPVSTLMTNVIGTTNLLEEVRQAKESGVCDPVIVSVSSSEVYGNPKQEELPITEENNMRAANPYSISKVGHDLMSQYYQKAFGLKIIITRMFSHEGSRRGDSFALSSFAKQIVEHEKSGKKDKFEIKVGNLNSIRTYNHISDAVSAYWKVFKNGIVGGIYNIGGDETMTVGNALEILLENSIIPRDKFNIVVDPSRVRPTDMTLQVPKSDKFRKLTGWKPVKTTIDICNDLLNYWREML